MRYWHRRWRRSMLIQADSSKKNDIYSPANAHAVFSIQTVKYGTHIFHVPLRRPHLPGGGGGGGFCLNFRQLKILKNMDHLRSIFFIVKKKNGGQASGWACRKNARNFRGSHKTPWTFGRLCVKMSKVRYFSQIIWW